MTLVYDAPVFPPNDKVPCPWHRAFMEDGSYTRVRQGEDKLLRCDEKAHYQPVAPQELGQPGISLPGQGQGRACSAPSV